MRHDAHVVITDSGLGGLSVCAALERGLRFAAELRGARLTYVNAWPYEDRGYNDLPDEEARARVFDSALARMAQMQPAHILIACNTLSILYPRTAFSLNPVMPVHGIVDAGVDLITEHLAERADASVVLLHEDHHRVRRTRGPARAARHRSAPHSQAEQAYLSSSAVAVANPVLTQAPSPGPRAPGP